MKKLLLLLSLACGLSHGATLIYQPKFQAVASATFSGGTSQILVTETDPSGNGGVLVKSVTALPQSAITNLTTDLAAKGATASPLSQFASTTSLQLAGVISDETGSGALVFGTSPTLTTPALGTPSAVVLTNGTGLPVATGISGFGTGVATFLGTPSSANAAAALTDETGSGNVVFSTSPTLVTPALGTPSAAVLTNATGLPLTTGVTGTLALSNGGTGQTSSQAAINALMAASGALSQGDVFYYNGTNVVRLAAGTSGQFLKTQGAGANPTWATASGGGDETLAAYGRETTQFSLSTSSGAQSAFSSAHNVFTLTNDNYYRLQIRLFITRTTNSVTTGLELTLTTATVTNFNMVVRGRNQTAGSVGTSSDGWFTSTTGNTVLTSSANGGWVDASMTFKCTNSGSGEVMVNFSNTTTAPATEAGSEYFLFERAAASGGTAN